MIKTDLWKYYQEGKSNTDCCMHAASNKTELAVSSTDEKFCEHQ